MSRGVVIVCKMCMKGFQDKLARDIVYYSYLYYYYFLRVSDMYAFREIQGV